MNYQYSGQSSPRRRTPPASPDERFVRKHILSHSDFPPSEHKGSTPTFASSKQSSPSPSKKHDNESTHGGTHKCGLEGKPLAMVYSPMQAFINLYDEETALMRGTLFSELDLPFEGSKCGKDRC